LVTCLVFQSHRRHTVLTRDTEVVCTEGRRSMNNSGTIFRSDEVSCDHLERLICIVRGLNVWHQLVIPDSNKISACKLLDYFIWDCFVPWCVVSEFQVLVFRREVLRKKIFREYDTYRFVRIGVKGIDLYIGDLFTDGEGCIGW